MATNEDILKRLDLIADLLTQMIALQEKQGPVTNAERQRRYRLRKQLDDNPISPIQKTLFATPAMPVVPKGVSPGRLVFEEAWKMWAPSSRGVKPEKQKARDRFYTYVKPEDYPAFLRAVRFYGLSDKVQRGYGGYMCNWIHDWQAWVDDTTPDQKKEKELVI